MEQWEYCVVYGGWNQDTYVYYLRDDVAEGYNEELRKEPGIQNTFKVVASLGKQGWESFAVNPLFPGATDSIKCTFAASIWYLRRRVQ